MPDPYLVVGVAKNADLNHCDQNGEKDRKQNQERQCHWEIVHFLTA